MTTYHHQLKSMTGFQPILTSKAQQGWPVLQRHLLTQPITLWDRDYLYRVSHVSSDSDGPPIVARNDGAALREIEYYEVEGPRHCKEKDAKAKWSTWRCFHKKQAEVLTGRDPLWRAWWLGALDWSVHTPFFSGRRYRKYICVITVITEHVIDTLLIYANIYNSHSHAGTSHRLSAPPELTLTLTNSNTN